MSSHGLPAFDVAALGDSDEFLVIGLDGEMSAADLDSNATLIQVGLAVRDHLGLDVFCELINPQMPWSDAPNVPDTMWWADGAAAVHGLSKDQLETARPASDVDDMAYAWLLEHGADDGRRQVITVGFNVMAFDHPFFRRSMPRTMSLIARRGIDLNAVCFTLAGWDPAATASTRHWTGWKRSLKAAGTTTLEGLGIAGVEHDAGYDAALALTGWEFLRGEVRRCSVTTQLASPSDPVLAAVFSPKAWAHIEHLDHSSLRTIAALLVANNIPGSKWLGARQTKLDGCTPFEHLMRGSDPRALVVLLSNM